MGFNGPLTPDYSEFMASIVQPPPIDLVHTYRMHVSQKYLDLTRQKLELVRLPQNPHNVRGTADVGVSKDELEPVIDHWLEAYNWRRQEDHYNDTLPQFRVPISSTRLHFVHKRSRMPSAVPLLFVHGVPESFIATSKIIDMLIDPMSSPTVGDHLTAFNVVAPSIPGLGFSDPVSEKNNNVQYTCDVFDALMKGLGYSQYVVHGSGWGFNIARAIALMHPESCLAVHTVNPEVPPPRLGFGFHPGDNLGMAPGMPMDPSTQSQMQLGVHPGATPPVTPTISPITSERPQTMAYALCDSPAGLLAYVYDAIRPNNAATGSPGSSRSPHSLPASSPQSPLSYAQSNPSSTPGPSTASSSPVMTRRSSLVPNRSPPKQPRTSSRGSGSRREPPGGAENMGPWSPTALVDWTMLYWLPGPEVALRWLVNSTALMPTYWASHSMVPLGISHFQDTSPSGGGTGQTPLQWLEAYHRVGMVKRREGRVRFPAWEAPVELVMDLREFVGLLGIFGAAPAPAV